MSIREELLGDRQFVVKSFLSLINDERDRIVSSKLLSKADCDAFIEKGIQVANNYSDPNQMLECVSVLLATLKGTKIPGDLLEAKTAEVVVPEVKAEEVKETQIEPVVDSQMELAEKVISKLESIAYFAGAHGDHETAFIIEQAAKNIKVAAEQGTLLKKENISEKK